jgi:segregation and condensation protein B
MEQIESIIQSIIFTAPEPISAEEITDVLNAKDTGSISIEQTSEHLQHIKKRFESSVFGFELIETALGYSFASKKENYPFIAKYIESNQTKKLSKSALETVSIIAFNPHSTKLDIEQIRGVSADYAIDKLLEKELIQISGKRDTAGNPITYSITNKFLDYFGIKSLDELPSFQSLVKEVNEIGEENESVNL